MHASLLFLLAASTLASPIIPTVPELSVLNANTQDTFPAVRTATPSYLAGSSATRSGRSNRNLYRTPDLLNACSWMPRASSCRSEPLGCIHEESRHGSNCAKELLDHATEENQTRRVVDCKQCLKALENAQAEQMGESSRRGSDLITEGVHGPCYKITTDTINCREIIEPCHEPTRPKDHRLFSKFSLRSSKASDLLACPSPPPSSLSSTATKVDPAKSSRDCFDFSTTKHLLMKLCLVTGCLCCAPCILIDSCNHPVGVDDGAGAQFRAISGQT